jgi:pSer/pThr/pTyr-binding forkhead associated (FHA) protein
MIQFHILSGKKAGVRTAARHFPFSVGRAAQNNLQLEDDGVWDRHLTFDFQKEQGFTVATGANALAAVNNQPVETARLRNGDTVTIGSVKLQFWLAAPVQRGLRIRELFFWALVIAVTAGQIALVYWLIR